MPSTPERPILGLSSIEAARILGVDPRSVPRLVDRGILRRTSKGRWYSLAREEVERVALERYRDRTTYWVGTSEAAEILGVGQTRVRQLVDAGKVPAVMHAGRWHYRRPQLEVVANARESRRLR